MRRTKKAGVAVVVGVILLQLAFWVGIIYAAVHFIRKYW